MTTVLGAWADKIHKRKDPLGKLPAAGHQIVGVRDRENADFSIRADVHDVKPNTPDGLKKFRQAHSNAPG